MLTRMLIPLDKFLLATAVSRAGCQRTRGYTDGGGPCGNIAYNDGTRTDLCTIADANRSQDARMAADHHMIADYRSARLRAGADGADLVDRAIGANARLGVHANRPNVRNQQSRSDFG